jgi:SSS family solute:Na+ symporter
MFWRRSTPWGGFAGLIAGTLGAFVTHELYSMGNVHFGSDQSANFGGAIVAFLADALVTVLVSLVTQPKPEEELRGLVWGLQRKEKADDDFVEGDTAWYRTPWALGAGAIVLVVILNILFI